MPRGPRMVAGAVGLVLLVACGGSGRPSASEAARPVVLSSGPAGSVAEAWGEQLAQQFGRAHAAPSLTAQPSSGNVANLRRLTLGDADLALTTMDALEPQAGDRCAQRTAASADDQRRVPLVALGRIYEDYLQIVTRGTSPVRSVADLAGRPVAVGSTGSGAALAACRVLSAAGVKVRSVALDPAGGLRALDQGDVDAVFWLGEQPKSPPADVGDLRLVPLGSLAAQVAAEYEGMYRPASIAVGVYGQNSDVPTLASSTLLVARADLGDAVVTDVLGTIFGRRNEMAAHVPAAMATDRRTAIFTGDLELHPAAVQFYREAKP